MFCPCLVNGKSPNSPDTPHSSSPESSTDTFFSFDNPILSNTPDVISQTNNFVVHETTILGRRPVVEAKLSHGLTPYFNSDDFSFENTPLESVWDSQGNFQHVNMYPCLNSAPCMNDNAQCMSAQSEYLMQTKAVVYVLRGAGQGISSGDIATKIAELSPSDVNQILSDLEQHHLVVKSGFAPILWSLVGNTDYTPSSPSKQPYKTLNEFSHPKGRPIASSKEEQYFEAKDPYFNQNGQSHLSLSQACTSLTGAILTSPLISATTTTAPSKGVRPYAHVIESTYTGATEPSDIVRLHANVIESNLLNMFQQNSSLTLHEIKTKLNFKDESRLGFILKNLLQRNVIVKNGDEGWRLAGSSRTNVGVIGEERKRRSPVESDRIEISKDKTPSKENKYPLQNGYHTSVNPASLISKRFSSSSPNSHRVQNGFHNFLKDNGNCARIPNGFQDTSGESMSYSRVPNACHISSKDDRNGAKIRNGFHVSPEDTVNCARVPSGFYKPDTFPQQNAYVQSNTHSIKVGQKSRDLSKQYNRASPPLPLKTETSEVLEDLTVTTPTTYQKELYEKAMLEDTVCYLPCGTGKHLVMAQVIAHMAILNPTKQSLVIVPDIVSALNVAQVLRNELVSKNKCKKLNVALYAGQLKLCNGKAQVVVVTSSTCLGLLNCGALLWKDVCLLIFHLAVMCCNDDPSKKILHHYYLKAKVDFRDGHVPKLLSFLDSSAGQEDLDKTVRIFGDILTTMGDVFLSSVSKSLLELQEYKREAMCVCVQTSMNEVESRMFFHLETYLKLVFDNLAAQWQPLNSYRELLKMSFQQSSVVTEAFAKLIHLTSQPPERRLPHSCLKTWRHYLAICEVIFSLVECGEDLAMELLLNLKREQFGFAWADDVGLPGLELSRQLTNNEISNLGRFSLYISLIFLDSYVSLLYFSLYYLLVVKDSKCCSLDF